MELSDSLLSHFSDLEDPRVNNKNLRHRFTDILIISLLATICGCDDWIEVYEFALAKSTWLKRFLELPNGIPSHDTFNRVFRLIDPVEFERCFISWVNSIVQLSQGEIVAIDGKTLRGSRKTGEHKGIHLVSAWASENRMVLGMRKVDDKSNEITAIPKLLEVLDIRDCVITMDAMGCQRNIAELIYQKGADYVFAVKENQGSLYKKVKELFKKSQKKDFSEMMMNETPQKKEHHHGRTESRSSRTLPLMYLHDEQLKWNGAKSIVMVKRRREVNGSVSITQYYFITSLPYDDVSIESTIRKHWHIENDMHWSLDVSFKEDWCRAREGHVAENYAIVRRIALNLMKNEKSVKRGVKARRKLAGWDNDYLIKVLSVGGFLKEKSL